MTDNDMVRAAINYAISAMSKAEQIIKKRGRDHPAKEVCIVKFANWQSTCHDMLNSAWLAETAPAEANEAGG